MKRSIIVQGNILEFVSPGIIYESITVLSHPGGLDITPLGILPAGQVLIARLYPATQLAKKANSYYEACISFTQDPAIFYSIVEGDQRIELQPATSLHTPCVKTKGPRIESVIVRRKRWIEDGYIIYMKPVHVHVEKDIIAPYSRLLGCTVELLIAYTRVRHWSKGLGRDCDKARENYALLKNAAKCIERVSLGKNSERVLARILQRATQSLVTGSCYLP